MHVPCWNCGNDIWIETQTECRHCGEPAKRCVDCAQYVQAGSQCRALDVPINEQEASDPTSLSQSYRCQHYAQSPAAHEVALGRRGKTPLKEQQSATTAAAAKPRERRRDQERPHVIAHRGHSTAAPENTLAAVRAAAELKVDAIEVDVHCTKDGVPVLMHDALVDRTTNGAGPIADLGYDQVRELDAGSWFGEAFAGEKVPTLRDALEAAGKSLVNIHLRCHSNESEQAERAILKAVNDTGRLNRVWVTHHTRHGLYRLRELEKKLRLCWLPRDGGNDIEYIDDAFYMGYRIIQPTFRVVTPEFVEYAKRRRMWINVFWADEEGLMRQLTDLGVNGILTNYPETLQEVLGATRREVTAADS